MTTLSTVSLVLVNSVVVLLLLGWRFGPRYIKLHEYDQLGWFILGFTLIPMGFLLGNFVWAVVFRHWWLAGLLALLQAIWVFWPRWGRK